MDNPVELIIFDCDGVLVDSEPLAMRVLMSALAEQGIVISAEDAYRDFLGRSMTTIAASVEALYGHPLSPGAHQTMRSDLYALYRTELHANPGLPWALQQLRTPFCVASSSIPERIRLSLELTGLLPYFENHIYSATMVENGKPAPDLFLHAASAMHTEPDRCLVIEDSPAGIAAAHNAGMRVFGYAGGTHIVPGKLREAIEAARPELIFDNMHKLPDLVGSPRTGKKAL
jgi:HAD superfamily hydrolase (TIGR01509 family)